MKADRPTPPLTDPELASTAGSDQDVKALRARRDHGLRELPATSWALRDIDWRFVLASQAWGTVLVAVFIVVALASVNWAATPVTRPFFTYDATISYKNREGKNTIPAYAAIITPLGALIVSLLALEFGWLRHAHPHISSATATLLHFILQDLCGIVTVAFVTELTCCLAGRLRPDFLQWCDPSSPGLNGPAVLGAGSLQGEQCQTGSLNDLRKSFPSGHSSTSAVLCVYNTIYLLWAGYFRADASCFRQPERHLGWAYVRYELSQSAYHFWILLQLAFTWGVGVSRFIDNKHHVSDIVAGWALGAACALLYGARCIALYTDVVIVRDSHRDSSSDGTLSA